MVLVQWTGLAPEDASWESWAALRETYNLEDEVVFEGGGVDSTSQNRATHNSKDNSTSRPKRVTHKPIYLKDFV